MCKWIPILLLSSLLSLITSADTFILESKTLKLDVNAQTGRWSLLDKRSGVRWPSQGSAAVGSADCLADEFENATKTSNSIRLQKKDGPAVVFELADDGKILELRYENKPETNIRVLNDALAVTDNDNGFLIVPCREGLLIPTDTGKQFNHTFGTSDYEGCHMNMLGLLKKGSALLVTWDDAYVFCQLQSATAEDEPYKQKITTTLSLHHTAAKFRLIPLGDGDWNTIAASYRDYAEKKGLAITLRDKIKRTPKLELLLGASNAKLWTCLARRMNEESTKEESVKVRWTFDEAAQIAEHLRNDLQIDRCLFMMGGWTESGYDCRHPDNLPANPECGGNDALADAIQRIQKLGYIACLHDNVQDMYRDARSWDPAFIEKNPDGSLIKGGRWLGGRAYMVCAQKQLELAKRPQNLPETYKLFKPLSYFIDTTYAVGPRVCHDPAHPVDRNSDIAWKIKLSDYTRDIFGIFGSECGREWALPHSDFFEGLVGVSGRYYHNLKPDELGAIVIPFWEMVYHDCQICFGKYGYSPDQAAEFVAHHILCSRPLYYHSFPDHLYWKSAKEYPESPDDIPSQACYTRCDNGWAAGMHPLDVFIKNTHEVLAPLHSATALYRLTELKFLTDDQLVRQAIYGQGNSLTKVTVNFGSKDFSITSQLGSRVVLPPFGFIIEAKQMLAFHARNWAGQDYGRGAMFVIRTLDGKPLEQSQKLRIFHAFGSSTLQWKDNIYNVPREKIIDI
jgi:hypothetical protein